jgi:hypothetical protein
LLSGASAALAIGSKDQAVGLVLGLGLLLLLAAPKQRPGFADRVRAAAWFSGSMLVAYAVFAVAVNPSRWWRHVLFVTSDHVRPEVEGSLLGQAELLGRTMVRLTHVLTPEGVLLGIAGLLLLVAARRHREALALFVPALAYYCFIIARVRATEERYLLPIALPLAVSAAVAVGELYARLAHRPALRFLASVLVAAALLHQLTTSFLPVTYCQLLDTKRSLAHDLPGLVKRGSPILLFDMASFNYPNRSVYQDFALMLPRGEAIRPPSTHGANLLHSFVPSYRYILSGSTKAPESAVLLRQWTYPEWIKQRVYVPGFYEFYLFQRPPTAGN